MAALDPTPEQCAGFKTIQDILNWAEVDGPLGRAFLTHVGLNPDGTEHFRAIAANKAEELDAELSTCAYDGQQLRLGQRAQFKLFCKACCISAGAERRAAEVEQEAAAQRADEVRPALAGTTQAAADARHAAEAAAKAAEANKSATGVTVALKTVVSQAMGEAVPALSQDDVKEQYARFRKLFPRDPRPEDECSSVQLTGLHVFLGRDVALRRLQPVRAAPPQAPQEGADMRAATRPGRHETYRGFGGAT